MLFRSDGGHHLAYDLTVDNEEYHEFMASGVIVSNCADAFRYGAMGIGAVARLEEGDGPGAWAFREPPVPVSNGRPNLAARRRGTA